ncbi:hypothetical protein [Actinospica robiniae]|uniref:hypothetical protein n=1 Tax=Actinospica robiniae TaxID=304901 RepID=UPI000402FFB5|nr:hypothetical protein [Actinospica robiniae]
MTRTTRRPSWPLLAAVVTASALVAAAGCASSPATPPPIPPPATVGATAAAVHQDARITLPVTVGLAFHHPMLASRAEHEVLFTVQQAMRAMVQAEYTSDGHDPELTQYWQGVGLAEATAQIKPWVARREQPVGVIVLSDTQYTAPAGTGRAKVSFCADWSDVVRGDSRTHVVGAAVQPKTVHPTYEELGLRRGGDRRWHVVSLAVTPDSPHCS